MLRSSLITSQLSSYFQRLPFTFPGSTCASFPDKLFHHYIFFLIAVRSILTFVFHADRCSVSLPPSPCGVSVTSDGSTCLAGRGRVETLSRVELCGVGTRRWCEMRSLFLEIGRRACKNMRQENPNTNTHSSQLTGPKVNFPSAWSISLCMQSLR